MPRETFQQELAGLRRAVGELGSDACRQLERAMDALRRRDAALAESVRRDDRAINDTYARLEQHAVALIARQAPMAGDLRLVLASLSTATELERIADHAADIAEVVERTRDAPAFDVPATITQMAERAGAMLRDALAAFDAGDAAAAQALAVADDEVDALEEATYRALIERARSDPPQLEHSVSLVVVAHHIERVADRATNIAEHTVYAASGVLDELNPSRVGS